MELEEGIHIGDSSFASSSCFTTLPDAFWQHIHLRLNKTDVFDSWDESWVSVIIRPLEKRSVIIWEDLGRVCQMEQIFLFAVATLVTIVSIFGNVFILVVIIGTGLVQEDTFLIRTALAVADLLMGLMPASLAVFTHVGLMTGATTVGELFSNVVVMAPTKGPLQFHHLRFERGGYALVCAVILTMTTSFSLFVLAILSVERICVITGKPLRRCHIVLALLSALVLSVFIALMLNWCEKHQDFAGFYDPISQLTLGVSASRHTKDDWPFNVSIVIWVVAGVTVLMATVVTLLQLRRYEQKAQESLTIHSAARVPEMRRLTETLIYMVLLFMLSCIPCIVDIAAELRLTCPVGHHLAWWIFMAGSSWNWALYTLRGEKFWRHARQLFQPQAAPADAHGGLKTRSNGSDKRTIAIRMSPTVQVKNSPAR